MTRIIKVELDDRVESGPLQFNDDWPGLFLRGDTALMGLKPLVELAISKFDKPGETIYQLQLRGLLTLIEEVKVPQHGVRQESSNDTQ